MLCRVDVHQGKSGDNSKVDHVYGWKISLMIFYPRRFYTIRVPDASSSVTHNIGCEAQHVWRN